MATEEPDPKSPEDSRLTSLNQRLKQAQLEEAARKGRPDVERSRQVVRSAGMRLLQDLVGLPFGGGLIGWLLDRWFGTAPWIMLAMLFLGFGLAVRNVMRVSKTGSDRPEGS
jgi:ATP synthase protein I